MVSQKERQPFTEVQRKHLPGRPVVRNAALAFLVGGAISAAGEGVRQVFLWRGLSPETAGAPTAAVMIFLGALLTVLGVYDELARVGGMGAALPVTGFANSIVAPAMEFKRAGWVMGVGARMFTVAGLVVVYTMVTSFAVGLIYYLVFHPRWAARGEAAGDSPAARWRARTSLGGERGGDGGTAGARRAEAPGAADRAVHEPARDPRHGGRGGAHGGKGAPGPPLRRGDAGRAPGPGQLGAGRGALSRKDRAEGGGQGRPPAGGPGLRDCRRPLEPARRLLLRRADP